MQLSPGVCIIDEKKFLETHNLRISQPQFKERLELYWKIKNGKL